MVNFDTRVFSEEEGQVIGAEVTVYSDNGDKIGNIAITDAESIKELQQQLAVIDETYFTEERLEAILANSQEANQINATTLSGFNSSDFAKVNQLAAYAPVTHNHVKSQITDLYNYQITASKYNVDIDTDVTITVKVTNQLGQPVVGSNVPVLKDNETWKSGTTGVNGTFSLTYTADSWGLVMFSTNNTNIQIKVSGLKLIKDTSQWSDVTYKLYVDESTRSATLQMVITNKNIASGMSNYEMTGWIPSQYRPKSNKFSHGYRGNNNLFYAWSNGNIGVSNLTSSTQTGVYLSCQIDWNY